MITFISVMKIAITIHLRIKGNGLHPIYNRFIYRLTMEAWIIMSKSTELDQTVKKYILNAIDPDYCEADPDNIKSLIDGLKKSFYIEHGFNVERIGEQAAFAEWLQGLPTACGIDFQNYEILKLAVLWGSIPENATEKQEDKILENWWRFIAAKTCQLFRGYHVPKEL